MTYPAWMEDAFMREPDEESDEDDLWDRADDARDRLKEEW